MFGPLPAAMPFSLEFEWFFADWPPGACCFPDGHWVLDSRLRRLKALYR